MEKIFRKKLWYITIEQFLMKYMWSLTGQCIIALPLLLSVAEEMAAKDSMGVSQRTKMYATAKHYLVNGGDAAERIMSSYKEVCVCVHVCVRVCVRVFVCLLCTYRQSASTVQVLHVLSPHPLFRGELILHLVSMYFVDQLTSTLVVVSGLLMELLCALL